MSLYVRPSTVKAARRFVGEHHRHNLPPNGGLFAVAAFSGDRQVGVGIAALPVARLLMDGWTIEITRVCTDGTRNACSLIYGALCRAAKALGYRRVITYTLESETGASVRSSGFTKDAECKTTNWNRPNRPRNDFDLFGNRAPIEDKVRWVKWLTKHEALSAQEGDGDE